MLDGDALAEDIFGAVEQQTDYRHYQKRIGDSILSQSIVLRLQ
jgi:hypothetical protein